MIDECSIINNEFGIMLKSLYHLKPNTCVIKPQISHISQKFHVSRRSHASPPSKKIRVSGFLKLFAALRLPFGLPFGREHFVVVLFAREINSVSAISAIRVENITATQKTTAHNAALICIMNFFSLTLHYKHYYLQ